MENDRTHKRGAQRSPSSSSLVGLALLVAGCTSGAPSGGEHGPTGSTGPGGSGPGPDGGPTPVGPSAACSVTGDTALGTGQAAAPSLVFSAGRFAAAWTEQDGTLHAAVIDQAGNIAGAHTLQASAKAAEPAVTVLPDGGFAVVWQEPGTLRAARIGTDASASGSTFTIAQATAATPRPAASGSTLAWVDTGGLFAANLNGTMIGAPVTIAGPGASDPALAAADGSVGLVFTMADKLGFAKLPTPVQAVTPVVFRDWQGKVNVPRVSSAGAAGFFVTWEDDGAGAGNETVYLSLVGADGTQQPPVQVPTAAGSANYPDVVTLGNAVAVAYYQFRDGPPAIYLSLFGTDLKRKGDEVLISGSEPARFPRMAAGNGTLGIAYAQKNGPAHFAHVTCQ